MGTTKYSVIVAEDEILLLDHLAEKIEACAPDFKVAGKAQTGASGWGCWFATSPSYQNVRLPRYMICSIVIRPISIGVSVA